jgi:hypothetical protein
MHLGTLEFLDNTVNPLGTCSLFSVEMPKSWQVCFYTYRPPSV